MARTLCLPRRKRWFLQHSLGFYGNLNHAGWVIIDDPMADGEFHVLLDEHLRPDLRLLSRDPVSHAVVMQ